MSTEYNGIVQKSREINLGFFVLLAWDRQSRAFSFSFHLESLF
nr:MAG TPA: hypothetical protein [Caudoviricetes sp.]